jgi:ribosome-associated translation inhibitor RaiA
VGGTVTKSKLTFNESALNEYQEPIKTMATTKVLTAGQNDNPISSLKKMIDSKINSIVRIDGQRRPTGFLSRSDFLSGLLRLKPSPQVPIMLSIKTPSLNEYYTLVCRWHTESYVEKSQKRWPAQKVSLRLKSAQNAAGKPSLFEVNLQYTLKNGQDFYAKAENHWYKQALIDAFKKLDKQLRRGG